MGRLTLFDPTTAPMSDARGIYLTLLTSVPTSHTLAKQHSKSHSANLGK